MIATVGRNILANAAGAGIGVLVFFTVVPIYLRLLGAEAYGLIGVLTTLTIAATALDLGLGATMNREVARMTAQPTPGAGFADVVATLQAACWAIGIAGGLLFVATAPAVATRWLTFSVLSAGEVQRSLALMGAALPALVLRGFYVAALNGLQRQGLTNLIQVGGHVARGAVSVIALQVVAPTASVFFATQLVLYYIELALLVVATRASLPSAAHRGQIRPSTIRPVLAFSGGTGATMLLGLALMSMDQVLLSAILPLAEFGYYSLAVTVAAALGQVVRPVTTAVYPRFSQLFERGETHRAAEDYHFFSQVVAVGVLPLGAVLIFFPAEVLTLWTRDPELVRHAALVLSLRTLGTVLNALMHVPHVVQLAFGWSTLGARINAAAVLVMTPIIVTLSWFWGGRGAALAWIILNVGILVIAMARMHTRVLPGELGRWYGHLLLPAVVVAIVGLVARATMPEALGTVGRLGWLGATGLVAAVAAVGASTAVRRRVTAAARPA